MESRYYAIEKIGLRQVVFCIKEVVRKGYIVETFPVDFKRYRTLDEAMEAAEVLGIEIKKTGDSYQII